MRGVGHIVYWMVAIGLLAVILVSLDYSLVQGLFIGLMFCPCALVLEFWMPKAHKTLDKVYLSLAVMVTAFLLIMVMHFFINNDISPFAYFKRQKNISPILINPFFLAMVLTFLSIGDYFWDKWLTKRFKDASRSITFFSDRRSITVKLSDIAYIESNDTEVKLVCISGESYRNKTGIGQWENLLGDGFIRIHRSYLANFTYITFVDSETISMGEIVLPISRKYKDSVGIILKRGTSGRPTLSE